MAASSISRFGSGQSVKRVEDEALLRGQGRFADNVPEPGQLYAYFVRSPHAHARITRIEVEAAVAMPGVARVITGRDLEDAGVKPIPNSADFRRADGTATISPPHRALAVDVVPTLCTYLGVECPRDLAGEDLIAQRAGRRFIVSEAVGTAPRHRAIRNAHWKLLWQPDGAPRALLTGAPSDPA